MTVTWSNQASPQPMQAQPMQVNNEASKYLYSFCQAIYPWSGTVVESLRIFSRFSSCQVFQGFSSLFWSGLNMFVPFQRLLLIHSKQALSCFHLTLLVKSCELQRKYNTIKNTNIYLAQIFCYSAVLWVYSQIRGLREKASKESTYSSRTEL